MYRIINNICPDYLINYVSYTSDISCRDTRSTNCNQLYTPKPNCELFSKAYMYSGAAIWNSDSVLCNDLINDSVFLLI